MPYDALLLELEDKLGQKYSGDSPLDSSLFTELCRVASLSDYFQRFIVTEGGAELVASGNLIKESIYIDFSTLASLDLKEFDRGLRKIRRREICRIIFRDFTRRADLIETTRSLSNLADNCVDAALNYHYKNNLSKYGVPISDAGEQQFMSVLALGKLGAWELNLSSDIDLMFFYGESGFLKQGFEENGDISNQEFFLRTSRQIIKSIDTHTADGFVFRVDMRLRPYGESSPLIVNQASLENYYMEQGRDWERYAFVKARAIAGDINLGAEFLDWLKPFVYRKQLDYGAIESLREMKGLINVEVERKEMADDIKLGPGGIRELEFIVQAQQLVWGGKKTILQENRFLDALEILGQEKLLPNLEVEKLKAAYIFLRNTEHILQGENDRQTQRLPDSDLSQSRLATGMGASSYEGFLTELDTYRNFVSSCFAAFLGANNAEKEILIEGNLHWVSIWRNPMAEENIALLAKSGFRDVDQTVDTIQKFRRNQEKLQEIAANRLHKLCPIVLNLCACEEKPDQAFERSLGVIESITRRSTYLAYLLENKDVMKSLVHLCAMSPWLTDQISKFPILLYELKNIENMSLDIDGIKGELSDAMKDLAGDDLEGQMDVLRQFKQAALIKVGVLELLDLLPIMKASDYLTKVAEIIIDKAVDLAFDYLIARHGEPTTGKGEKQGRCFAVIAYGKLGGIELAYGSDLDLVFLHDADIRGETEGEKVIPNNVFFSRLGQRIVHILSSFTRFGLLYEIDLRLRPDGNKGPLVSTFNAFERYLNNEAWTWEHQALVRSRFVAGNTQYKAVFEDIRQNLLFQEREEQKLKAEVRDMREKMRIHLSKDERQYEKSGAGLEENGLEGIDYSALGLSSFDLKHSTGAIVDIEFLVQYLVLFNSHLYKELVIWTDKVRLIENLASLDLLSEGEAKALHTAYLAYRAAVHFTWLGGELASYEQLNEHREDVVQIWRDHMLD